MNDLAQMVALLVRYPELEKEELLKYVGLYVRIEIKLQALEIAKEYQVDIALLLDWCKELGKNYQTTISRINKGWQPKYALLIPKNIRRGSKKYNEMCAIIG